MKQNRMRYNTGTIHWFDGLPRQAMADRQPVNLAVPHLPRSIGYFDCFLSAPHHQE